MERHAPVGGVARLQQNIILLLLLLTPVFSAGELVALFGGTSIDQTEALTPTYIKAIKDAGFLLIILLGFSEVVRKGRFFAPLPIVLFLAVSVMAASASLSGTVPAIFLAGVRFIVPVVLILFVYNAATRDFQLRVSRLFNAMMLGMFLLQLLEMVYLPPFWGAGPFGLNTRNPGFFLLPASGASFACLALYYNLAFRNMRDNRIRVMCVICGLGVVLTASGMGLMCASILLLASLLAATRYKLALATVSLGIFGLAFAALPTLTNRSDIFYSALERVKIAGEVIGSEHVLVSSTFGRMTNTGVLMSSSLDIARADGAAYIADSLVVALAGNIGLLGLFLFGAIIIASYTSSRSWWLFVLMFGSFSLSSITLELFPLNMLLALNVAYFARVKSASGRALTSSLRARSASAAGITA